MQPIQYQTDLTPYNTFGLRAQAQAFIALKHANELPRHRPAARVPTEILFYGSAAAAISF